MYPLKNSTLVLNLTILLGFLSSTNNYASLAFLIIFSYLIFPLFVNFFFFSGLVLLITYILLGQTLSGGIMILEELIRMLVFCLVVVGLISHKSIFQGKVSNLMLHFIAFILVLFAAANIFNIEFLINLREILWPLSKDNINSFDYGVFGDSWFRVGSIYYNPNVFGEALAFLIVFYLLSDSRHKPLIIFLLFVMVLFTGSRTATLSVFLILFFSDKRLRKWFMLLSLPSILIISIYFSEQIFLLFRALDFVAAVSGESSGSVKLSNIIEYLSVFSSGGIKQFFILLLGNGFIDQTVWHLDSEIGLLIYSLGLVGLIILLLVLFLNFLSLNDKSKPIYFLFIFSIGSTLLLSLKFAPLFLILSSSAKKYNLYLSKAR